MGNYLKQLADADLARAARYFAGHQFAQNDARTTNVGGSIISTALSEATGVSFEELGPNLCAPWRRRRGRPRSGDGGESLPRADDKPCRNTVNHHSLE